MNTGTLPRFLVYSELYLHVASKYSFFNFGTFCIVGGRRLLITASLLWKDMISGHSESSTCMLSKHIGKKGDQLCTQMKLTRWTKSRYTVINYILYTYFWPTLYIHSSHTTSYVWDDGSGAGLKAPISKGRHLIIVHAGNSTLNSLY